MGLRFCRGARFGKEIMAALFLLLAGRIGHYFKKIKIGLKFFLGKSSFVIAKQANTLLAYLTL